MRKEMVYIATVVLLSVSVSCVAKEPTYQSAKPLYVRIALDENETRVLTLAFDESTGTGKGYDTIYADLNLNGDLTDEKAVKGSLQKYGRSSIVCSFPPALPAIPYNDKAKGIEDPWQIVVNYHQFTRTRLFGLLRGETYRSFFFEGRMKLRDTSGGEWSYSMSTMFEPGEISSEVSPIGFRGKPTLEVEAKSDPQKKGNTGIAVALRLGDTALRCLNPRRPVKAHILVKDQEGQVVHSEDVGLDKLFFG